MTEGSAEAKIVGLDKDITYIKEKLENIEELVKEGTTSKADHRSLEARVAILESNLKWTSRSIIGGVISIVVGVIIALILYVLEN